MINAKNLSEMQILIKIRMSNSQKLFKKGLSLFQKGEYKKALHVFKKVPEKEQASLKYYHIGMCYVKLGKYEKALNMYKKVREIPVNEQGVQGHDMVYGMYINMGSVMQIIGRKKMKKARMANLKSTISRQKEEMSEEQKIKEKLKQRRKKPSQPKDKDSPSKETTVLWRKMLNDAITCYEYALEIKDNDARVWNNLGNAYLDLNKYGKAIENLDKALALDNGFAEAYYSKALAYSFMQIQEKAIEYLEKALQYKPENRIYLLRIIALLLGNNQFKKALKYAQDMAKYHPKNPESYKFLTLVLYNMEDYERAYESFKELLQIRPNFSDPELDTIFEDLKEKVSED